LTAAALLPLFEQSSGAGRWAVHVWLCCNTTLPLPALVVCGVLAGAAVGDARYHVAAAAAASRALPSPDRVSLLGRQGELQQLVPPGAADRVHYEWCLTVWPRVTAWQFTRYICIYMRQQWMLVLECLLCGC